MGASRPLGSGVQPPATSLPGESWTMRSDEMTGREAARGPRGGGRSWHGAMERNERAARSERREAEACDEETINYEIELRQLTKDGQGTSPGVLRFSHQHLFFGAKSGSRVRQATQASKQVSVKVTKQRSKEEPENHLFAIRIPRSELT